MPIDPSLVAELPRHLFTYHGVGLGPPFGLIETRAILAARLQSLVQGASGVRYQLLEALAALHGFGLAEPGPGPAAADVRGAVHMMVQPHDLAD